MLQHGDFKFDSKEDFLNYIEKKIETYWKAHNDSFSAVCEELDSWDGFLGDDRIYSMDELDDLLCDRKPSEVLKIVDTSNFDYSDDYFYYDIYGIRSTNEKDYYNYFDYSDVFEKLTDNYCQVFSRCYGYGRAYYELFSDIEDINNSDENEIQSCLDEGDYDYLFEDDFFSDDDLD